MFPCLEILKMCDIMAPVLDERSFIAENIAKKEYFSFEMSLVILHSKKQINHNCDETNEI